ncbi:hypothetical protein CCACVL1_21622 [Corchorus capsularis]|uniref:Uncharacterized protein n=1 Tax=Corchorus capsularis TaxID=210143 RepID=A0A1R3H337_COCAP|nr:hypothetical protein CCACVL1_21622 [Corchorus capsularis]
MINHPKPQRHQSLFFIIFFLIKPKTLDPFIQKLTPPLSFFSNSAILPKPTFHDYRTPKAPLFPSLLSLKPFKSPNTRTNNSQLPAAPLFRLTN